MEQSRTRLLPESPLDSSPSPRILRPTSAPTQFTRWFQKCVPTNYKTCVEIFNPFQYDVKNEEAIVPPSLSARSLVSIQEQLLGHSSNVSVLGGKLLFEARRVDFQTGKNEGWAQFRLSKATNSTFEVGILSGSQPTQVLMGFASPKQSESIEPPVPSNGYFLHIPSGKWTLPDAAPNSTVSTNHLNVTPEHPISKNCVVGLHYRHKGSNHEVKVYIDSVLIGSHSIELLNAHSNTLVPTIIFPSDSCYLSILSL